MADNPIVGRCTCPICGLPAQDVKENINRKLYGYCDNGCAFKFNSAQSRKFLPELLAGRNVALSTGLIIFSTKTKELKQNDQIKISTGGINAGIGNNTGNAGGINADGRTTGNRTGSDARNGSGQSGGRRPWVSWLTDGDDDDDD